MIKNDRIKKARGKVKLTVCVATISNKVVFGAADRMITAGEVIQYQPNISKIWLFTNSIAALVAADIGFQKMVFDSTFRIVTEKNNKNPEIWLSVKEVAELYVNQYNLEKNLAAERQKSGQIEEINLPGIETLIIGCDQEGPHIFSLFNEEIICSDVAGFAAIGTGQLQAESYLMSNKYSPRAKGMEALVWTHRAKKIAETAPGVGDASDMMVIGPELGFHWSFPDDVIAILDAFYEQYKQEIKKADENCYKEIGPIVQKYIGTRLDNYLKGRSAESLIRGIQSIKTNNSSISHK